MKNLFISSHSWTHVIFNLNIILFIELNEFVNASDAKHSTERMGDHSEHSDKMNECEERKKEKIIGVIYDEIFVQLKTEDLD